MTSQSKEAVSPQVNRDAWLLTGTNCLSKSSLNSLRQRNNLIGLIYLGVHLCTLAVTGSLVYATMGSLWVVPSMIIYGSIIVFLFAPMHECSHFTAFRSRWLNYFVGMFAAVVTIRPFLYFKWRHAEHHTYAQDPTRDPDAVAMPQSFRQYVVLILGAKFWPKMIGTLWRGCTGRFDQAEQGYIPHGELYKVSLEIRIMVFFYALIALASVLSGSWVAVIYWLLPRVLGEPVLRAIRMAEHTGAQESPDLLSNTRTTLSNPIFRTLFWNMPFHAEHHIAASVPFHALGRLHEEIKPHLRCVGEGYWQVHRQIQRQIAVEKTDSE